MGGKFPVHTFAFISSLMNIFWVWVSLWITYRNCNEGEESKVKVVEPVHGIDNKVWPVRNIINHVLLETYIVLKSCLLDVNFSFVGKKKWMFKNYGTPRNWIYIIIESVISLSPLMSVSWFWLAGRLEVGWLVGRFVVQFNGGGIKLPFSYRSTNFTKKHVCFNYTYTCICTCTYTWTCTCTCTLNVNFTSYPRCPTRRQGQCSRIVVQTWWKNPLNIFIQMMFLRCSNVSITDQFPHNVKEVVCCIIIFFSGDVSLEGFSAIFWTPWRCLGPKLTFFHQKHHFNATILLSLQCLGLWAPMFRAEKRCLSLQATTSARLLGCSEKIIVSSL